MYKKSFTIVVAIIILLISNSINIAYSKEIRGSLDFRVMPNEIRVIIFFYKLIENIREPYTDSEITSRTNSRFQVDVSDSINLSELHLDIHVIKPDDHICVRRDLDASDPNRLKDIPIRARSDYCHVLKGSGYDASQNKEHDTALYYYKEAVKYCPKDEQLILAVLDFCDHLSRYREYREKVVDLLERNEFLVEQVDKKPLYNRYILLRKDSIKRLYGYNDSVTNPERNFTDNVIRDINEKGDTPYTRMRNWYSYIKSTKNIEYPPYEADTVFINAGNL